MFHHTFSNNFFGHGNLTGHKQGSKLAEFFSQVRMDFDVNFNHAEKFSRSHLSQQLTCSYYLLISYCAVDRRTSIFDVMGYLTLPYKFDFQPGHFFNEFRTCQGSLVPLNLFMTFLILTIVTVPKTSCQFHPSFLLAE